MSMVSPAGRGPGTSVRWVTASDPTPLTPLTRPAPGGPPRRNLRRSAELAWWPVDAMLAARDLSNLVVMAATLAVAVLFACVGGLTAVIVNLPALAVVWGAVYGLIRLGRWWRGVRPPEHEPPRAGRRLSRAASTVRSR